MNLHKRFHFMFRLPLFNLEGGDGGGTPAPAPAAETPAPSGETTAPATPSLLGGIEPPAVGTDGKAVETPAEGGTAEGGTGEGEAVALTVADIKLPEGVELDDDQGKAFIDIMNDKDLSPADRANKLFEVYQGNLQMLAEQQENAALEAWNNTNADWQKQVSEMPEFKGKMDAELGAIKQALLSVGATKETFDALTLTGFGNNPHGLKLLHSLTKPYREGKAVGSGVQPRTNSNRASRMYPTMAQE